MNSNKHNKILLEALEVGLVAFQGMKDSKIILNKVKKEDRFLSEIYLRSLRNFLEVSNKEKEDQWHPKKEKTL
jgi:hypothetical protein